MKGQIDVDTPEAYLDALDEPRRSQIAEVDALIRRTAPELTPHVRDGMLAYGTYHYRYASGREGDSSIVGLASNARAISLYVSAADGERYLAEEHADRLGKVDVGKSCVRFRNVDDLDLDALAQLIRDAVRAMPEQPGVTVTG